MLKAKIHRVLDGKLKTVTISITPSGKYFASLLFDDGLPDMEQSTEGKAVGVDLGLTHFAITSDGSKFDNPRVFKKRAKNLKRKQQKLCCTVKGSNTRQKARRIVARVQEKMTNTRQDLLHKLSRKLVNENQVIVVEKLAVKNMVVKNYNLAKAIRDASWAEFTRMLKYKAGDAGKVYIEVDRFFPSSKTCSVCLNRVGSLSLNVRSWQCKNCETKHDRDVNAAINIRDEGLRILALGTSATAKGGSVRPKVGRRKSSVSQAIPNEFGSPIRHAVG